MLKCWKSGQVFMPCGFLLSVASVFHEEQCFTGWAVPFLMAGVSSAASPPLHWFSSTTKTMRTQSFEVTAHSCFQPPPQTATESAINETGFHQQDLTSVIVCSSPHHTVTPHYILDKKALAKPDISGQGFVYQSEMGLFLPLQNSQCVCIFSLFLPFRTVSISC